MSARSILTQLNFAAVDRLPQGHPESLVVITKSTTIKSNFVAMESSSTGHRLTLIVAMVKPMIEQKAFAVMEPVLSQRQALQLLAVEPRLMTTVSKFAAMETFTLKHQLEPIAVATLLYMIITHKDAVTERLLRRHPTISIVAATNCTIIPKRFAVPTRL